MSSPAIASDLHALPAVVQSGPPFRPELDPKLGARLAIAARWARRDDSRPILVVFAGNCAECSLKRFEPRTLDPSTYSAVVLIYEVRLADLPAEIRDLPKPFHIVCDPSADRRKELNAAWWPRFYLTDASATLNSLQSRPLSVPPFVHFRKTL